MVASAPIPAAGRLHVVACVALALLACSPDSEQTPQADAATAQDAAGQEGGALLQPVVPPEASDLWPLAAGWRLRVTRTAPNYPAEVVAALDGPLNSAIRVAPFAGVATSFSLELRDASGTLRARARTSAAIFDQTEPDRLMPAFVLPMDSVVTAVHDEGPAGGAVTGLLGRSVTAMGTGEVLLVGGSAYAGGAPCDVSAAGAPVGLIQRYDPADGHVLKMADLAKARSFHAAVPLSTVRLAVLGGYVVGDGGGLEPTATVELVRLDAGVVQQAPQGLSTARARACAVAVGKRLVIAGGTGAKAASVEIWDPAIGTVGKPAPLSGPRYDAGCATAVDPANERTLFLLAGGATGAGVASDLLIFAVDDSSLVPFAPITLPAGGLSGAFVHAPLGALALVLAGGFDGTGSAVDKAWINLLAAAAGGWQTLPALSAARGCAASTIVGNGSRALLVGGMGVAGEPLATLELVVLDGSKNVGAAAALSAPHAGDAAATLTDGSVLLVGGVRLADGKLSAADGLWRYLPADAPAP